METNIETIVLDPISPVIIIDISMLFYNAYFEAMSKFYLANGDNRLAYREMMKEIRQINAPDIQTFKTLAGLIVRRGDLIDYSNIHKNNKFMILFKTVIERLIKKICNTVSSAPYRYGNALLVKDCRRYDNWRTQKFNFYKKQRASRDIVTNHLQFNGKVVEDFWNDVYPRLKNELGIRILNLPTLEADDLAYFAKLKIRQVLPTAQIIIVTRDYDYLQLVDDKTSIITFDGIDLNSRGFGSPLLNLSIKIMTGDVSDNISPIFYGCGEKTAQKIILKLYPQFENDINLAAEQFINDIENITNVSIMGRNIMRIVTESLSARSRGRPITTPSRIPDENTIITNLTQNILLIQMTKIPTQFIEQFSNKYHFTTYELGIQKFERLMDNRSSAVQQQQVIEQKRHSADEIFSKKVRSNKKRSY